ncbi:eukaryotic translation initiation factor 4 gamma 3-like [Styela clava]
MTTQPRGVSTPGIGLHPSQPQLIPNKFNQQQQFAHNQAYSPMHNLSGPTSSPHHSGFYPPGNVASNAHDIYKNSPGVSGTPPTGMMMMQPGPGIYPTTDQRQPRAQMMMAQRGGYYYQQMPPPRYQSPQAPATSPSYYPNQGTQFQWPHGQQMQPQQQHMYNSPYAPQFARQQQQQIPLPPSQQLIPQQPHQPPQPKKQRVKITIKDPTTNQDVTESILKGSRTASLSTPPSGRSSATPPASDVSAEFAAKVAAAIGTSKPQPMIVGSPGGVVAGMPPGNPAIMNVQRVTPSSSPRPPHMPPPIQPMMSTQFMHPSQKHSSPGNIQPQMMSPMYRTNEPQPSHPTAYQLPPTAQNQVYGTSPMSGNIQPGQVATNMPDNVHTCSVPAQAVNIPSSKPPVALTPSSNLVTGPPIRPIAPVPIPTNVQVLTRTNQPKEAGIALVQENDSAAPILPKPVQTVDIKPDANIEKKEMKPNSVQEPVTGAEPSPVLPQASEVVEKSEQVDSEPKSTEFSTSDKSSKTASTKPGIENAPSDSTKLEESTNNKETEDAAIKLPEKENIVQSVPDVTEPPISKDDGKVIEVLPASTANEITVEKDSPQVDTNLTTDTGKGEPSADVPTKPAEETPKVKIVPATPPTKVVNKNTEEQKAPVPSAKIVDPKTETKPEPVQYQVKVTETKDKESGAPTVTSPEPPKSTGVVSPQLDSSKQFKKEESESKKSKTVATKQPSLQETEKSAVNGVSTEAAHKSVESNTKEEKVADAANPKTSKNAETKTPESKPQTKEDLTHRRTSSSSEKVGNKTTDTGKTNGVIENSKALNIKYDDDQWSPNNPRGKRHYDSNFLLQFQYKPTSLEKPKDLPDIDIVLEQPHKRLAGPMTQMEYRGGGGSDFTPNYMQQRSGNRSGGRQRSQDHRRPSRTMGPKIIQKVVSIDRPEVQLKRTDNAWKPTKLDSSTKQSPEEKEFMEIQREVRAVLNKLTPSTFPKLIKQVLEMKIDTERKLRGAIDLVFEKAIDEPNFCEVYANMCRQMTALRVAPELPQSQEQQPAQPPPPVEFRKLLLTKCQKEFEKNKSDQEHLLEMKKKLEENTDEEVAPQLKEEYDLAEAKERRRTLGNIRFIGELFKLRMLTENIMHSCIMSLFKARDDDHLESLCRLLTTIGKDLDHVKGKQRMDQYFTQIQRVIQEKRTSARVRFMLQDVYDLRLNSWVPRAITVQGPKTITQIHQDAKEEQELLQLKIATAPSVPQPMKQGSRSGGRLGSRGHGGEDGWTKVQTTPKPTRYDPSKMKLKTNQFDENKVTLGPPTRNFGGWKSGSSTGVSKTGSGSYSPSASMDRTPETGGRSSTPTSMMNRFSALGQQQQHPDYEYQRRQGGRQSSREGTRSGSRGSMGPPSAYGSGGRTPRKEERTSALETARKLTSKERSFEGKPKTSRESSPSLRPQRSSSQQKQQPSHNYNTDLDEEKMQAKSKSILEEFLSIVDYKEATECIDELNAPPSLLHSLVFIAHEFTLEKNTTARTNIGRLMAHLLKRGKLSAEQYIKGLMGLLEMGPDCEIDIPKVWEYIAEQMAPVFEDESESDISLSCLNHLSFPLQEEDKSGIFVAEFVKAVIKNVTMATFVLRWRRNNMVWSKILGKDKTYTEQFLSQHNLQDLSDLTGNLQEVSSSSEDKQYRLEQEITKLLESNKTNEQIFDWVDTNVSSNEVKQPVFIRALTIGVCKKAIDMKLMTVDKKKMTDWSILLKKYIENVPDRELQALYGLQYLMVILEQPPNVLRTFFDVLYDMDVIVESSFNNWKDSTDPNEQDGRGVALASVNPFFTWLRSAEPESD